MNIRRWLEEHSLRLLAIRDSPEAIAGGVAIGIFFWFPPLLGLKTVCAIFFAWVTRCNILAAVIAVTLHDVLLPMMLLVYRWEYCLGYWILSTPHRLPRRLTRVDWVIHHRWTDWRMFWRSFSTVGKPLLLGSFLVGIPCAGISFVAAKSVVARHQRKRQRQPPPSPGPTQGPGPAGTK